ncbi:MAG: ribonuclease III domain-containing protein [Clostridia bacterium]
MGNILEISEKGIDKLKAREINPLVLAFLGDAVHTLFVRNYFAKTSGLNAGKLHLLCVKFCRAQKQAAVLDEIFPDLTDDEKELSKRARNTKNGHQAKHASEEEYKKATSFEALIGFWHMTCENEKLKKVLEKSIEEGEVK